VSDAERLAQLLSRLKEVCATATDLAREVRDQLRDVERRRQVEGRAAARRSGATRQARKHKKR
jgi:hypothetical protein